jgi:uncharacterized integral membrane protein (TIGR00697 family)
MFIVLLVVTLLATTLICAEVVKRYRPAGWGLFVGLMTAYLITNSILVPRIISFQVPLLGLTATVVSGTVFWPFIAQMADMTNEIYGRTKAYLAAGVSFLGRFVFAAFVLMAAQADPVFSNTWTVQHETFWDSYFSIAGRSTIAALVSYVLQQWANIYVFARLKEWSRRRETTRGKRVGYGMVRSFASDVADVIVDSPTFYVVLFAGILPWNTILAITVSAMAVKFVVSQLNHPFYALFRWRTFNVEREF